MDETLGDFKAVSDSLREDIDANSHKIGAKADLADIQALRMALQTKLDSQVFLQEIAKMNANFGTEVNTSRSEFIKVKLCLCF